MWRREPALRATRGRAWARASMLARSARQLLDQFPDHNLRIAKQHPRSLGKIQRVVDAGKARILASLDREHRPRLVGFDDRHAVNRARLVGVGGWIDDVIRADDECN